MEILLDTNFVITCTNQKIDFFSLTSQIIEEQVVWLIPDKVLNELKKISKSKDKKIKDKQSAELFFELLAEHRKGKAQIKTIKLKIENVDDALVDFCNKNKQVVLATLDKKLKSRISNRILTLKGKRFLRIVD